MNILYVFADNQREWNCSEWRCAVPMRAINKQPALGHKASMIHIEEWTRGQKEAIKLSNEADIIFVQRLVIASAMPTIEHWKAEGKIIVGDIDDAYHFMPEQLNAYGFWHKGEMIARTKDGKAQKVQMSITPIEQLEWGLKLVHAISSPSIQLLEDWSNFNPSLLHMPNYIAADLYLPNKQTHTRDAENIVIGWGGSHSHVQSWTDTYIMEALRFILEDNKNVIVEIAGGDERIYSELMRKTMSKETAGEPRVRIIPWMPAEKWPKTLAKFDIGLIPLAGKYDQRRSWVKSLEYTLMGIPWVGTKGAPTDELKEYGTTITNSVQGWRRAIQTVLDDYDTAKAKVDAGREYAEAQDVNKNVLNIVQKYDDLIAQVKGQ